MQTVREYIRRWVDDYFSSSDPITSPEDLTRRIVENLPFEADKKCDDWTRETLWDTLHTPTTPLVEIIREECEHRVDETFADIVAPHKAQDAVAHWDHLEAPDDQVPKVMAQIIRERYQRGWERGHFDLDVRLYEAGKLRAALEEEQA